MKPKPEHPCPLCKVAMNAELNILAHTTHAHYAKVSVKFWCSNSDCRYEERTRGQSSDDETISKMLTMAASFRGPEMFKHGRFKQGSVGVNRRKHVGVNQFVAVDPPKE